MNIKTTDFRSVRSRPYVLTENRLIRIAEHARATVGEKFYQHEDAEGNILLIRACNVDKDAQS